MTITIILAIWFACSVIASPLIGWLLFTLGKEESIALHQPPAGRSRFSFDKSFKLLAPRHRSEFVPPVRRAARGR
ncbi:MAG TPA: hypothetical protein VGH23_05330 [Rhizomicrobium sp.]|jgi:hypothetical protein